MQRSREEPVGGDHHGEQELIEVTRRCDVRLRFVIDYADTAGVPIPVDPRYPSGSPGWARSDSGSTIGAVRHQFRNERGGGFTAKLAVAFPATLPPWIVTEHRWHLAVSSPTG